MNKQDYLAMDAVSLQNIVSKLHKEEKDAKERIEKLSQFEKSERDRLKREYAKVGVAETALKALRIESESLSIQIESRKKELSKLLQLHTSSHESHGKQIGEKKQEIQALELRSNSLIEEISSQEKRIEKKREEIVSLTKQIQILQFEVANYQKTILLASNQLKEIISTIRVNEAKRKTLDTMIRELKRTLHITAEHVLTERNKRLYRQHKQMTRINQALQMEIERKRKQLK